MKALKVVAWATVIAVLVGCIQYIHGDWPFDTDTSHRNGPSQSHEVGPEGGTLSFDDGVVITVPKGAVKKKAEVRYGNVRVLDANDPGPLMGSRSSATSFDVSLIQDGLSVQPARSLTLTMPDKTSDRPFAYTALPGNKKYPYALLDTWRPRAGMVSVTLSHLSPKVLTHMSDDALAELFHDDEAKKDLGSCKQDVTVNGAKVRIGTKEHWSLDKVSPIYACMVSGTDAATVGVTNNFGYLLRVSAPDGVRTTVSGGNIEDQLIKKLYGWMFPDNQSSAVMGGGDKLVAAMSTDSLPVTIQAQATVGTFLTELSYDAAGFLVGMLAGIGRGGALIEMAAKVIENAGVIACFQDAFGKLGSSPGVKEYAEVISDCFMVVAGVVAENLGDAVDWFGLFKGVELAKLIVDTATRAITELVVGTMKVGVEPVVSETSASLSTYVGLWYSTPPKVLMTIRRDGTGETQSEVEAGGDYPTCTAYTALSASLIQGGFQVRYGETRYVDCPSSMSSGTPPYPTGSVAVFKKDTTETILSNSRRLCRGEQALSRNSCTAL
ncbi:MAG TPA: hypothetical protein VJ841_04235 [Candidatus Saccharimonadales bacterium]|nr:hypothetical protein [Candidatus Saccharimonadales bacterium]